MTDTVPPPPRDETPEDHDAPTTPAQRQAIETLFRTSYPQLVSYALYVRALNRADAEDAVQHAFEKVLAGHRCLADPDPDALLRYIHSMIDGVIKTAWRDTAVDDRHQTYNAQAVQAVAGPTPLPAPDSAVLTADLDATMRRILASFPLRQRQVWVLHQQGYTYRQIAALLQISVSTVNNHMVRILEKLRNQLRDWLPQDAPDDTTEDLEAVEDDT